MLCYLNTNYVLLLIAKFIIINILQYIQMTSKTKCTCSQPKKDRALTARDIWHTANSIHDIYQNSITHDNVIDLMVKIMGRITFKTF